MQENGAEKQGDKLEGGIYTCASASIFLMS